jgi:hypothetical protein
MVRRDPSFVIALAVWLGMVGAMLLAFGPRPQ